MTRNAKHVIDRMQAVSTVAEDIRRGLVDGTRFRWGAHNANRYRALAAEIGAELVTMEEARERGRRVRADAMPVGYVRIPGAVPTLQPVYVLDPQTSPIPSGMTRADRAALRRTWTVLDGEMARCSTR